MLEAVEQRAHERLHRQPRILVGVGDAEPAAEIDDGRRPAELGAAVGGERGEPVDRHPLGADAEQLRADVHVEALRVQAELAAARERRGRLLRRQPELRAAVAGGDRPVRVGVDARRHAHEHAAHAGGGCALGVVGSVEHDEAAGLRRRGELLVRLVVSVQHDLRAADAGAARERELAERRGLGAEPLLREHAQHGDVGERLHAVEDGSVAGRLPVRARPRSQGLLAVDDERRAVRRPRATSPRRRRAATRRPRPPPNRGRAAAPT